MPTFIDHALVLVLVVLFPLRASTFGFRRLERASEQDRPRVRRSVYLSAIGLQWTLAAVVMTLWALSGRSWAALGVIPRLNAGLIGILAGSVVIAALVWRQRREALRDDETLERLRHRMRRLEIMLPHAEDELSLFFKLSITAGVCEELLYRGYLIWYLAHWMGTIQAAGLAAVVFGVGHLYQGWRGVLTTGAVGAFLGGIFLLCGSLYPGMALHALMDAHSGHLMFAAYRRAARAAAVEPAPEPADVPA